jgi:hypothetical protein
MYKLKKALAYAAVVSLVAGGFIATGAPAARASTGPVQPEEESSDGIGVPVFGLIAIAGIATIAIWQGINDAKKKKQAQLEEEQELEEQEEYEEYFDFGPAEPDAAGTPNPESTAAPAESAAAVTDE